MIITYLVSEKACYEPVIFLQLVAQNILVIYFALLFPVSDLFVCFLCFVFQNRLNRLEIIFIFNFQFLFKNLVFECLTTKTNGSINVCKKIKRMWAWIRDCDIHGCWFEMLEMRIFFSSSLACFDDECNCAHTFAVLI